MERATDVYGALQVLFAEVAELRAKVDQQEAILLEIQTGCWDLDEMKVRLARLERLLAESPEKVLADEDTRNGNRPAELKEPGAAINRKRS